MMKLLYSLFFASALGLISSGVAYFLKTDTANVFCVLLAMMIIEDRLPPQK